MLVLFFAAIMLSNKKRYGYITAEALMYSILFLLIYMLLFMGIKKTKKNRTLFYISTVLVITFELFINTGKMLEGVRKDWNYPSRSLYSQYYKDISSLVNETKKENAQFYRMANLNPVSQNESFNYGYNGVSMFSSIRNRHSSSYLDKLGFRSTGSNLYISYQNNTLLMDTLLGIKYNLSKESPMKYGFEKQDTKGSFTLYKNKNALPLAIRTDRNVYKEGAE